MILTNRFQAVFNFEKIDQKFEVYLITKPKGLYYTRILDYPTEQLQILAVQYAYDVSCSKALLLVKKDTVSESWFQQNIMEEYPDVTVKKLDILNENIRESQFGENGRLLLQLLVNSIHVPKREKYAYNNLTGKLLYWNSSWQKKNKKNKQPYMMYFLELSFDKEMCLNMNVKTFQEDKYASVSSKSCYLIDQKSGCFRRKLSSDRISSEALYTQRSFSNSKNTVKFLDFSSIDSFRKCKLGVMEQFLQDVKKRLGPYVTLTQIRRTDDACYRLSKRAKEDFTEKECTAVLKEKGLNIVDTCKTEESMILIHHLSQQLQKYYGITATVGDLQKEMYNFRIIHDVDFYKNQNQSDPHQDDLQDFILQHITLEAMNELFNKEKEKISPGVKKAVTELIIKGEVHDGKIRIFDWQGFSSDKVWYFAMRIKLRQQEDDNQKRTKKSDSAKPEERFEYASVRIDPEGVLQFRRFDDRELPTEYLEEKIRFVFDTYVDRKKSGEEIEGIVFSDIDNVQVIIKTNEKTTPNTSAIEEALQKTDQKENVSGTIVIAALCDFKEQFPQWRAFADGVISRLEQNMNPTKNDLRKAINMHSKAGKMFNRFLHDQHGIWISPEIKNPDFKDDYQLESVTDIRYFEDTIKYGKGVCSFNYYASIDKDDLKLDLHNACIIRRVQAERVLEFRELLPLLAVDFVRANGYTALPFPFKYLREYLQMQRQ